MCACPKTSKASLFHILMISSRVRILEISSRPSKSCSVPAEWYAVAAVDDVIVSFCMSMCWLMFDVSCWLCSMFRLCLLLLLNDVGIKVVGYSSHWLLVLSPLSPLRFYSVQFHCLCVCLSHRINLMLVFQVVLHARYGDAEHDKDVTLQVAQLLGRARCLRVMPGVKYAYVLLFIHMQHCCLLSRVRNSDM